MLPAALTGVYQTESVLNICTEYMLWYRRGPFTAYASPPHTHAHITHTHTLHTHYYPGSTCKHYSRTPYILIFTQVSYAQRPQAYIKQRTN